MSAERRSNYLVLPPGLVWTDSAIALETTTNWASYLGLHMLEFMLLAGKPLGHLNWIGKAQ